jgi:hypothetical protein
METDFMRQLYVLSKPIDGKPRRLIGVLSEENGKYTFEYKLGGKFSEWFLQIDEFPDPTKVYSGEEVHPYIKRKTPPRTSRFIKPFMKQLGLEEYDEWAFLKYGGQCELSDGTYLLPECPQDVIRYDTISKNTIKQ